MDNSGNIVKKRKVATERNEYREALEWISNFLDNESVPRSRPAITEWTVQRVHTIRTLNEFKEKLDTLCVYPNSGNAVGNTAENESVWYNTLTQKVKSVTSSLSCIIGNGLTSIPVVSDIGKMIQYTGTCVAGVSDTMTSRIPAKYLQEIEKILEEDLALSRPIEEWLNFSKDLDSNIQTVFGVGPTSGKFHTIKEIFHDFLVFSRSDKDFDTIINHLKQEKYAAYIGKEVQVETLENFYQCLSASPQFADKIHRILSFSSVTLEDIQVFLDGIRLYKSIIGICNSSVVPALQGSRYPEIPSTGLVPVVSVFQTIGLALSVISLINPASIARYGASKYSDALKHLSRSLAWELEKIKNL